MHPKHGLAFTIMMPFADEAHDEGRLDREEQDSLPDDFSAEEIDAAIKCCASELRCWQALKAGDKQSAARHHKELMKHNRELSKLRGEDDAESDE